MRGPGLSPSSSLLLVALLGLGLHLLSFSPSGQPPYSSSLSQIESAADLQGNGVSTNKTLASIMPQIDEHVFQYNIFITRREISGARVFSWAPEWGKFSRLGNFLTFHALLSSSSTVRVWTAACSHWDLLNDLYLLVGSCPPVSPLLSQPRTFLQHSKDDYLIHPYFVHRCWNPTEQRPGSALLCIKGLGIH